jgi:hypothetical protein
MSKFLKFRENSPKRSPPNNESKLDLVIYLDYLGYIDVESKYLQAATIPWLIAEIKLLEFENKISPAYMEINVKKNTLNIFRVKNADQNDNSQSGEAILSHKLTDIFKLTCLPSDPFCFAYFYRQENSFNYNLYAFYSNKFNINQVVHEFQVQALRMHESLKYEKIFDFKLVTKVSIIFELKCVKSGFFSILLNFPNLFIKDSRNYWDTLRIGKQRANYLKNI